MSTALASPPQNDAPDAPETPDTSPAEAEDAAHVDASIDDSPKDNGRVVPVTEAIRYRKRAQAAEQQLKSLQEKLEGVEAQLAVAHQAVEAMDQQQAIDTALVDADAVDLEVARLLTEVALDQMADPDIGAAVSQLRRTKPYLFRHRDANGASASAMPARNRHGQASLADDAAQVAATTGHRRDVLRYLRLRRRA